LSANQRDKGKSDIFPIGSVKKYNILAIAQLEI